MPKLAKKIKCAKQEEVQQCTAFIKKDNRINIKNRKLNKSKISQINYPNNNHLYRIKNCKF